MKNDYETSDRTFKAQQVNIQIQDHFDFKKDAAVNRDELSA